MSQIPAPKKPSRPKRLQATDDLDSSAHQTLLDFLWFNLETVVVSWLRCQPEWLGNKAKSAIVKFNEETSEIVRDMELFITENADPAGNVSAAKERFENALFNIVLPPPPEEALFPELLHKQYQQPITVVKYDRQGYHREETIGYIDIGCNLSIPSHLKIEGCPFYFQAWDRGESPERRRNHLTELKLGPVSWTVVRDEMQKIWFDVRSALPHTGVLIQELRVIRALADSKTMVTLVCDEIPKQVAEVVKHEGFWCLTRSDICRLLDQKA